MCHWATYGLCDRVPVGIDADYKIAHRRSPSRSIKHYHSSTMPLHIQTARPGGKAAPRPAVKFQDKMAAELIHLIVSFIPTRTGEDSDYLSASDMADLRSCAQLSRAFSYPARQLLFSTIELDVNVKPADKGYFIRRVEQLARLIKLSGSERPIAPLIKTLIIACPGTLAASGIQDDAGSILDIVSAIAEENQGPLGGKLRRLILHAPYNDIDNVKNSSFWRAGLQLSSAASIRSLALYGFKDIPVNNFYGCTFDFLGLDMCNFAATIDGPLREPDGRSANLPIIKCLSWNSPDCANLGPLDHLALFAPVSGIKFLENLTTLIFSLKSTTQTRTLGIPTDVLVNSRLAQLYIDITGESQFSVLFIHIADIFTPEWTETSLQYDPISQDVIDVFHKIPEVHIRASGENASLAERMWAIGSVLFIFAGLSGTQLRDIDNGARIGKLHLTIPPALFWPADDDFRVRGPGNNPLEYAGASERFFAALRQLNQILGSERYRNVEQTIVHLCGDMSGYYMAVETAGGPDILLRRFRDMFFGTAFGFWALNMRPRLDAVQCFIDEEKFQLEEPESDDESSSDDEADYA